MIGNKPTSKRKEVIDSQPWIFRRNWTLRKKRTGELTGASEGYYELTVSPLKRTRGGDKLNSLMLMMDLIWGT
jgi:hypothetical protein